MGSGQASGEELATHKSQLATEAPNHRLQITKKPQAPRLTREPLADYSLTVTHHRRAIGEPLRSRHIGRRFGWLPSARFDHVFSSDLLLLFRELSARPIVLSTHSFWLFGFAGALSQSQKCSQM